MGGRSGALNHMRWRNTKSVLNIVVGGETWAVTMQPRDGTIGIAAFDCDASGARTNR